MGFNSGYKGLNTKFDENPSSGSRGRRQKIDEADRRFEQFCERA